MPRGLQSKEALAGLAILIVLSAPAPGMAQLPLSSYQLDVTYACEKFVSPCAREFSFGPGVRTYLPIASSAKCAATSDGPDTPTKVRAAALLGIDAGATAAFAELLYLPRFDHSVIGRGQPDPVSKKHLDHCTADRKCAAKLTLTRDDRSSVEQGKLLLGCIRTVPVPTKIAADEASAPERSLGAAQPAFPVAQATPGKDAASRTTGESEPGANGSDPRQGAAAPNPASAPRPVGDSVTSSGAPSHRPAQTGPGNQADANALWAPPASASTPAGQLQPSGDSSYDQAPAPVRVLDWRSALISLALVTAGVLIGFVLSHNRPAGSDAPVRNSRGHPDGPGEWTIQSAAAPTFDSPVQAEPADGKGSNRLPRGAPPGAAYGRPLTVSQDRAVQDEEPQPVQLDLRFLAQATEGIAQALSRLRSTLLGPDEVPDKEMELLRQRPYRSSTEARRHMRQIQELVEICTERVKDRIDQQRGKLAEALKQRVEAEALTRKAEAERDAMRRDRDALRAESENRLKELRKSLPPFIQTGGTNFLQLLKVAKQKQPNAAEQLDVALRSYAIATRQGAQESEYIDRMYEVGERLFGILTVLDTKDLPTKDLYSEAVAWMQAINEECYGKCRAFIPVLGAPYRADEMLGDRVGKPVSGYKAWGVRNSKGVVVRTAKVE